VTHEHVVIFGAVWFYWTSAKHI